MSSGGASLGTVYFVQERPSFLIKIGATADCPYLRLGQLRRKMQKTDRYSEYELLGVVDVPSDLDASCSKTKHAIQSHFEQLRDNGDWFRPGSQLLSYIQQHTRIHICDRTCPDGSSRYEDRRADEERASAAILGARRNYWKA